MTIAVVGATGDVGRRVVARLCEMGHAVTVTSRSPERLSRIDSRAAKVVATFTEPATLARALAGADRIINLAHASTTEQLIAVVPATCQRLITVGSTRRYSQVPDATVAQVARGEDAFLGAQVDGSMLHPTMIYGGDDERNISQILDLVDRWPRWLPLVWPVPAGGRALVQPVHVDDVAAAVVAAVTRDAVLARIIIVAGPTPIALADMLRAAAAHRGRRLRIVPLPAGVLVGTAWLLARLCNKRTFSTAELRRTLEDKAYDIEPLRRQLGVEPRSFTEGLRQYAIRHSGQTKLGCREQSVGG